MISICKWFYLRLVSYSVDTRLISRVRVYNHAFAFRANQIKWRELIDFSFSFVYVRRYTPIEFEFVFSVCLLVNDWEVSSLHYSSTDRIIIEKKEDRNGVRWQMHTQLEISFVFPYSRPNHWSPTDHHHLRKSSFLKIAYWPRRVLVNSNGLD